MSFAIGINTEFPSLLYQLITMNTMFYAIMFSLLAVASADSLKIVNNCAADFEISSISTSSERVLCFEMKKIAVGNQIVIDDFDYDEIMLLKSSAKPDSNSFTYIDTLENLIENQDDIGGECAKLVKSGNVKAYSVEPGVLQLNLCANKPSPTPPSPDLNPLRIVNNCVADFEISLLIPPSESGVECLKMKKIAVGDHINIDNRGETVLLKSSVKPDPESFNYMGTLKSAIKNFHDIDGKCAQLVKSGNFNVYWVDPDQHYLTLCPPTPPTPLPPTQYTITNKCSNKFEFAHFNHSPGSKVVCSPSIVIPGGKQLSYISGTPDFVIIKTASTKDTPNFVYLETLQSVIDLYGDANGECQKLINSGFNAVYEPTRAHMTLCA